MGRLCYPTLHPGRVLVPASWRARKLSRCKEGMARVFAVQVQILLSITRVAPRPGEAERSRGYKFDRSREFITGYKFGRRHWRSVAVQTVSEPESCQGTENLNAGRCGSPGTATITNLSWVQE